MLKSRKTPKIKREIQKMKQLFSSKLTLACLCIAHIMHATVGYFDIGYGTKARGMGGVATALPQDSLVAATNPAGMVWVNGRVDVGGALFSPIRQVTITSPDETECTTRKSNSNIFLLPHAGINSMLNDDMSLGCSIYGNGGMNTNYPCNIPLFGTGPLGVNYLQLITAPTVAKKVGCHSFGASILGGIQIFKWKGAQNFDNPLFSSSPCSVTNNAHNIIPGLGGRVGWMGNVYPNINLGFAYATQVYSKQYELYKGLFAQHGHLNIPANQSAGKALENIRHFTLAFDFQYIFYGKIRAISNPISQLGLPFNPMNIQNKFGSECGPGFGWENLPVYKIGLAYDGFEHSVWRLGFVHARVAYPTSEIDLNIITPAVVKDHLTAGMTMILDEHQAFDFAFLWAFKNKYRGQSQFGLGFVEHQMWQFAFSLNYGVKF